MPYCQIQGFDTCYWPLKWTSKDSIENSRRNDGLLAIKIVDTEFPVKPGLNGVKASYAPGNYSHKILV